MARPRFEALEERRLLTGLAAVGSGLKDFGNAFSVIADLYKIQGGGSPAPLYGDIANLIGSTVATIPNASTKVVGQSVITAGDFEKLLTSGNGAEALSNLTALSGDITALVGGPIPTVVADGLGVGHDTIDLFNDFVDLQNATTPADQVAAEVAFDGTLANLAGDIVTLVGDILGLGGAPKQPLQVSVDPGDTIAAGADYVDDVASFTDPNVLTGGSAPPASSYCAMISWGDGTTSVGQVESIVGLKGYYNVVGNHTYAQPGDYPILVLVNGDGTQGQGGDDATVEPNIEPYSLVPTGAPDAIAFGQTFHDMLITFQTNALESQSLSTYNGVIDWGDGTTSAAQFVYPHGGAGHVQAWGTHDYGAPGAYSVDVEVTAPDGSGISGTTSVLVNPGAILASGPNVTTMGLTFSGTIATFRDGDGDTNPHDFTADIAWHDGTPDSTGTIVADGHGGFALQATHTFAQLGEYNPEITIYDDNDPYVGLANPLLDIGGATLSASNIAVAAGQTYNGTLATFTWPDSSTPASAFYLSVDWGDDPTALDSGSNPPQLVADGQGVFSVVGSHVFGGAGIYQMEVSILPPDGYSTYVLADRTATVGSNTSTVTGQVIATGSSPNVNGTVATFTVPGGSSPSTAMSVMPLVGAGPAAETYTATIYWGDGNTSAGQIVSLGGNRYAVTGSHTYPGLGTYQTTVQITDSRGDVIQAHGTVDHAIPTSQVNPLPTVETSPSFTVAWSGGDPGGPGIAGYDVYVSDDGGPFTRFQSHTTATSAIFHGQDGHTYRFYSVATDRDGNAQPTPGVQATTSVSVSAAPGHAPPGSAPVTITAMTIRTVRVHKGRRKTKAEKVLVLQFSGALDPNRAGDLAAYQVLQGKKTRKHAGRAFTKPIALASAGYDPSSHTVTLLPSRPWNLGRPEELRVGAEALTDLRGRPLASDFVATCGDTGVEVLSG